MSRACLTAMTCILLTGCVLSIETAIPGDALLDEPRLLGTWEDREGERAVITRGDSGYTIRYTDGKGRTGRYLGRLGRAAGHLALEVSPRPDSTEMSDGYRLSMIPGRYLLLLRLDGDEIRTVAISDEDTDDLLRAGTVPGPALFLGDDYVLLTGDAAAVRRSYERLLAQPGLISSDTTRWRRVTGP